MKWRGLSRDPHKGHKNEGCCPDWRRSCLLGSRPQISFLRDGELRDLRELE